MIHVTKRQEKRMNKKYSCNSGMKEFVMLGPLAWLYLLVQYIRSSLRGYTQ